MTQYCQCLYNVYMYIRYQFKCVFLEIVTEVYWYTVIVAFKFLKIWHLLKFDEALTTYYHICSSGHWHLFNNAYDNRKDIFSPITTFLLTGNLQASTILMSQCFGASVFFIRNIILVKDHFYSFVFGKFCSRKEFYAVRLLDLV